jgi:hypothetical protein
LTEVLNGKPSLNSYTGAQVKTWSNVLFATQSSTSALIMAVPNVCGQVSLHAEKLTS